MKFLSSLLIFVLLGLVGFSIQASMSVDMERIARTCKPYETFTGKCESPCQPHCPKYGNDGKLIEMAVFCVASCDYKCICKEGLVRDELQGDECVPKDKCLPPLPFEKKSQ